MVLRIKAGSVIAVMFTCIAEVQAQKAEAFRVTPVVQIDSVVTGLSLHGKRVRVVPPSHLPESLQTGFCRKGSPEIRVPVICIPSPQRILLSVLEATSERLNRGVASDAAVVEVALELQSFQFSDVPGKKGRELKAEVTCVLSVRGPEPDAAPRTWTIKSEESKIVVRPRRHIVKVISGVLANTARQAAVVLSGL